MRSSLIQKPSKYNFSNIAWLHSSYVIFGANMSSLFCLEIGKNYAIQINHKKGCASF